MIPLNHLSLSQTIYLIFDNLFKDFFMNKLNDVCVINAFKNE